MTQYNYIIKLINIQDENIEITNITIDDDSILVDAAYKKDLKSISCPKCGSLACTVHGYFVRIIQHTKIINKTCVIRLKVRRYKCKDCNNTFYLKNSIIDKNKKISKQLQNSLLSKTSTKVSFTDIGKDVNLSTTTVIREFKKDLHDYRCELTEVICIDEFRASTIAGEFAFIIGDPISGRILDVLPSRKQDYIIWYFQTLHKDEISKVKYIVSDLFEAYRTVIQAMFPKAIHIVDRFHWIKLCTKAFNDLRIRTMNYYLKASTEHHADKKYDFIKYANMLKHNYKLLLVNRSAQKSWYFDEIVKNDAIGNSVTKQDIIEQCLNQDRDLEEGYLLLQELYRIARYSNVDNAKKNILDWCNKVLKNEHIIKEFNEVAYTYKRWIKELTNSFILNPITHQRMTNGFIEGKNNMCKVIKRIGFGYKDFDLFRKRILEINKK